MKKHTFLIILCLLGIVSYAFQAADNLKKITVAKVPILTTTIARVNSGDFEKRFEGRIHYMNLGTKEYGNRIMSAIQSSKMQHGNYNVDVRVKLFLEKKSGKTDTICIGSTPIFSINDTIREFTTEDLLNMLDSLPDYRTIKTK